ncbi:CRISPR-associated protein Cas4 [Halosolutus halophilus]|uniref:CRISPR-associated protein Cas4 n=1 Tax=Halosolutus halophilus TaxID=1552990 RepID=UPI0022350BDF|nr:Dna2/Cas4 domain-containing protein [Halosolutus halophilus]
MTRHVAFSDLRTVAYCPRKCYYQRTRDDHDRASPPEVAAIRGLATRYDELLDACPDELATEPIAVPPATYRERLATARDRLGGGDGADGVDGEDGEDDTNHWDRLRDPADRDVLATGRDCRGIVHKVLAEPVEPAIVSAGKPPERGVWQPQSVHAVAAAKALAWEHETPVERAWLEYPASGVIRRVELTTRRKAEYRAALRTVRELDGPPPRIDNRSKCAACEFADECGVRTRTLRSLLGFG